jgi:hypothetical protein
MQLAGQRHGVQENCMPMKLLHANAKAFEERESRRMGADEKVTVTTLQPHPLVAFQHFWRDRAPPPPSPASIHLGR